MLQQEVMRRYQQVNQFLGIEQSPSSQALLYGVTLLALISLCLYY